MKPIYYPLIVVAIYSLYLKDNNDLLPNRKRHLIELLRAFIVSMLVAVSLSALISKSFYWPYIYEYTYRDYSPRMALTYYSFIDVQ